MTASYLDQPLLFRIRKVARYVRMYGISRTFAKVRGQFHMARDTSFDGDSWSNPACRSPDDPGRFVALVGCGNFAHSAIAYYLKREKRQFLRATYDVERARAVSMCRDFSGAYAAGNFQQILDDPKIRLVYIASNHASHANYATRCIRAGKDVHIEKPHVVTDEQLTNLLAAKREFPDSKIFLGFNRPKSKHFAAIRKALDSESGPIMINWFIAGHEIPDDHWYFREEEGGRVLGNLCHWSDLTLEMVGVDDAFPCTITPASDKDSKSDFCIGVRFADASVAGITFSAKGHTFEGVREVLQAHRGNSLIASRDFEETKIEVVEKVLRLRTWHRDHGHGENVVNSYIGTLHNDNSRSVDAEYVSATAMLFLGIKKAIDSQEEVVVQRPAAI